MSTQKEEAEVLRQALRLGLVSVEDVVAWADAQILRAESPDPVFLELSLSRHQHPLDLCALLGRVPGDAAKESVGRQIFKLMLDRLNQDESTGPALARALYEMALAGEAPTEGAEHRMWGFDDAFTLARDRTYGTVEQSTAELREFLWRERPPEQMT